MTTRQLARLTEIVCAVILLFAAVGLFHVARYVWGMLS
jgi:hypothetical protein